VHQHFFNPLPAQPTTADAASATTSSMTCCGVICAAWTRVATCCGLWGSKGSGAAASAGRSDYADSEGSLLDDVDLEVGRGVVLTEKSPLLQSPSSSTKSASYGDAAQSPRVEQEEDEQGDLPDEPAVPAAGAGAAQIAAPKPGRKRKKRQSMYDSTMHALGFAPEAIEHAAEVQLMTADGSPAGKVRTISASLYTFPFPHSFVPL
jgi:hypothetical protein